MVRQVAKHDFLNRRPPQTRLRVYLHVRSNLQHWPHEGLFSSHFRLLRRHSSHPCRDLCPGISSSGHLICEEFMRTPERHGRNALRVISAHITNYTSCETQSRDSRLPNPGANAPPRTPKIRRRWFRLPEIRDKTILRNKKLYDIMKFQPIEPPAMMPPLRKKYSSVNACFTRSQVVLASLSLLFRTQLVSLKLIESHSGANTRQIVITCSEMKVQCEIVLVFK